MQTARKTNNLDALTSLRFIAAAAVVIKHSSLAYTIPKLDLPLGNFAVSFFFVLSGFILTFAYQNRLESWADCRRFWMMRIARIWPVSMVCLALAIFFLRNPSEFYTTQDGFIRLVTAITSTQAWIPHREFGYGINPVSWSISVEFFFYLMFPFLFWGGFRRFLYKMPIVVAASLGITGFLIATEFGDGLPAGLDFQMFIQCNPIVRLLEFTLGVFTGFQFVAWRERTGKTPSLSFSASTTAELFALALIPLAWYIHRTHWYNAWLPEAFHHSKAFNSWLHFCSFAPIFAVNVFVFAVTRGPVHYLLSRRPLVYLGEISFSLYMIHFIVLVFLNNEFRNSILWNEPWLALLTIFALSTACSVVLYHGVELPGKWFITHLYDGKFRSAIPGLTDRVLQAFRSPVIMAPFVICFIATAYLTSIPRDVSDQPIVSLSEILQQPRIVRTDASFDKETKLHAFWYEEEDDLLVLNTVWTSAQTQLLQQLALCNTDRSQLRVIPKSCSDDSCVRGDGHPYIRQTKIPKKLLNGAGAISLAMKTPFRGTAKLESDIDQWPANRLALPLPLHLGSQPAAQEIINSGDQYWETPVQFENHSKLNGYKWVASSTGLKLVMLWNRNAPNQKKLFAHICQSDGKILRQSYSAVRAGRLKASRFVQTTEIEFSWQELSSASIIGLGYFEPQLGWGQVNGGFTTLKNRRLEIPIPEPWGQELERAFVENNKLDSGPISFGDAAQLLALDTKLEADGWHIKSAWRKTGHLRHIRFAHICDEQGKILRHAQQTLQARKLASILPIVMDEIVIPFDQLAGARSLGFGFYSEDAGTLTVDAGLRSMRNHRLDIPIPVQHQAAISTSKVKQASYSETPR